MLDELRQLPEQLPRYQKQIQRFFDLVLDVDRAGREPQQQAANHYLYDAPPRIRICLSFVLSPQLRADGAGPMFPGPVPRPRAGHD